MTWKKICEIWESVNGEGRPWIQPKPAQVSTAAKLVNKILLAVMIFDLNLDYETFGKCGNCGRQSAMQGCHTELESIIAAQK